MKRAWIEREEEGGAFVHARRWPCRFDLSVSMEFPRVSRRRLARAVRQDMWRALQSLRGFSPAIRVEPVEDGLRLEAGGQMDGRWPRAVAEARLQAVLGDPRLRARWISWASALVLALFAGQSAEAAEPISGAPSGLGMELHEFLLEPQGNGALGRAFAWFPRISPVTRVSSRWKPISRGFVRRRPCRASQRLASRPLLRSFPFRPASFRSEKVPPMWCNFSKRSGSRVTVASGRYSDACTISCGTLFTLS